MISVSPHGCRRMAPRRSILAYLGVSRRIPASTSNGTRQALSRAETDDEQGLFSFPPACDGGLAAGGDWRGQAATPHAFSTSKEVRASAVSATPVATGTAG